MTWGNENFENPAPGENYFLECKRVGCVEFYVSSFMCRLGMCQVLSVEWVMCRVLFVEFYVSSGLCVEFYVWSFICGVLCV